MVMKYSFITITIQKAQSHGLQLHNTVCVCVFFSKYTISKIMKFVTLYNVNHKIIIESSDAEASEMLQLCCNKVVSCSELLTTNYPANRKTPQGILLLV